MESFANHKIRIRVMVLFKKTSDKYVSVENNSEVVRIFDLCAAILKDHLAVMAADASNKKKTNLKYGYRIIFIG